MHAGDRGCDHTLEGGIIISAGKNLVNNHPIGIREFFLGFLVGIFGGIFHALAAGIDRIVDIGGRRMKNGVDASNMCWKGYAFCVMARRSSRRARTEGE